MRAVLLTGAGKGFCAGQDLGDRNVAAGSGAGSGRHHRALLQSADPAAAGAGEAGRLRGQRGGRRGRRQPGAGLRHRPGGALGAVHPGLLPDRAGPDSGGTWFLPRLVGEARARALALTGEAVSAEQAQAWGLIWRVVDDERLRAEAEALAQRLAEGPTRGPGPDQAGAERVVRQRSRPPARPRARSAARGGTDGGLSRGRGGLRRQAPTSVPGRVAGWRDRGPPTTTPSARRSARRRRHCSPSTASTAAR